MSDITGYIPILVKPRPREPVSVAAPDQLRLEAIDAAPLREPVTASMPPPAAEPPPARPPSASRPGSGAWSRPPLGWLAATAAVCLALGFPAGYLWSTRGGLPDARSAAVAKGAPVAAAVPAPGPATAEPTTQAPLTIEAQRTEPLPTATTAGAPTPAGGGAAEKAAPTDAKKAPGADGAKKNAAPAAGAKAARDKAGKPAAKFRGTLVVSSKPEGARVLLDGRAVGTTPLTLPDVAAGAHVLKLELDGYATWSDSVQVAANKKKTVSRTLERRPGG